MKTFGNHEITAIFLLEAILLLFLFLRRIDSTYIVYRVYASRCRAGCARDALIYNADCWAFYRNLSLCYNIFCAVEIVYSLCVRKHLCRLVYVHGRGGEGSLVGERDTAASSRGLKFTQRSLHRHVLTYCIELSCEPISM